MHPPFKKGLREVYSIQLGIEIPPTPLYERLSEYSDSGVRDWGLGAG